MHAQEREPVAALWAAEASIYGRFGYAPASLRGGLDLAARSGCGCAATSTTGTGAGPAGRRRRDSGPPAVGHPRRRLRRFVPGNLARDDRWWERLLRDEPDPAARLHRPPCYALHTEADGTVTGYASYRLKAVVGRGGASPTAGMRGGRGAGETPAGHAALWQFLLPTTWSAPSRRLDGVIRRPAAPPARPTPVRCTPHPVDALWVRLVDVDRALSARRYPAPIDLVLEVRDDFCPWNSRALAAVGGTRLAPTAAPPTATPISSSASRSSRRSTWAGCRWRRCRPPVACGRSARVPSRWHRRRSAGRSPRGALTSSDPRSTLSDPFANVGTNAGDS